MSRLAANRQLQKLIVMGIAAFSDDLSDFDDFCIAHQCREELQPLLFRNVSIEFGTSKHLVQFCDRRCRYLQQALCRNTIEGLT